MTDKYLTPDQMALIVVCVVLALMAVGALASASVKRGWSAMTVNNVNNGDGSHIDTYSEDPHQNTCPITGGPCPGSACGEC